MHDKGTMYWITGLSGAGKTTIGTLLYQYIKTKKDNVVFLDGDILREIYQTADYSAEGRKKLAYQHGRLCKMLTEQNIDVVICVIAMYEDCRRWNRKNIERYQEIYLDVSMDELIRRDQKQLYSKALRNEISNVMGINMEFEAPENPTLRIDNSGELTPEQVLEKIKRELGI